MSKKLPVVTSRGGTVEPPRLTPAPPPGRLIDSPRFPAQAKVELGNPVPRQTLHPAMTTLRDKLPRVCSL